MSVDEDMETMKFCKVLLLLSALLRLLCVPAQAVTVEDLFTVELPVADQTTSLRLESFSDAFKQVIVKVSGSDDALQSPAFERPIANSARYVKQFRYLTRDAGEDEAGAVDAGRLVLRIDFDQQLVEGLLREQGFPVWGRERPSTLLVISYDVNENIRLVSDDATPDLVEALDESASALAVPVLFPLMDLEDTALVSIGDIAARQYGGVRAMARRYSPNAVLVGRLFGRSGSGWQGDWEVSFDDQTFRWTYQASSRQDVLDQAIRNLARTLASEYALEGQRSVDGGALLLSVSDLGSIDRLIEVRRYLESLNAVDSVRVALISQNVVTYELKLRNDPEDLQRLIEFGDKLEQEDFPQLDTQGGDRVILNYSYVNRGATN